ncbi:octanoyltransferase [Candidatus Kuenenia stuttgartiensis]|jgi:lipoate-protein ligase B|uniref:Octanoyltransferase n=1 Tax=Kuenenia stuttgartiensis TaxID=174633 RepID=A0A2C9CJE2_KUEST|nr:MULTISPECIES: lipoyl(octanoyl) transferase LipB [Kuenenia]MBE7548317.1 lipoyl(octanoyl) transferase LipB [Planctomycetia bacterium]MBW7941673.1 lipoyl(octanoyl) transferase LipB [Candidatus Kuenenia stuttgartiensis]MBZ0191157.1 lipoyl(octanoyl) transferase LipB [Candidatus Kuenenia stuttgartiensis]MCF6151512.1 lipoyl(octanoyl) transferase LipB [Candidatus Kuenenia stuttgartiensis]MCL4726810.1 lipoyl(octanoyl) transferase LipB [Candidatus Kuenenia stuttgartiensis]
MNRKSLILLADMVEYGEAWELQKTLLELRTSGKIEDCLLLLQHPPTFTYGRRYKESNLISNKMCYEKIGIAVYKTDRGGLATYHGPGQVVGYPILKMRSYTNDYYEYLRMLEEVMIQVVSDYGITVDRRKEYTGVWADNAKIGFIGVRIATGYTMHGFSLNVNNDLSPFEYITPCGIDGIKVASLQSLLNTTVDLKEIYERITNHYANIFQTEIVFIENTSPYSITRAIVCI